MWRFFYLQNSNSNQNVNEDNNILDLASNVLDANDNCENLIENIYETMSKSFQDRQNMVKSKKGVSTIILKYPMLLKLGGDLVIINNYIMTLYNLTI